MTISVEVVNQIHTKLIETEHKCRALLALRDTLLPELISRELRVNEVAEVDR